jgi:serine/threonine protein phosphatase PrpC
MTAIRHAVVSDKGLQHKKNEDRFYVHPERGLYFVTDGMANEVTPHFVLETLPFQIRDEFTGLEDLTGPAPAAKLQALLRDLNDQIRNQRLDLWAGGNAGATLVLALVRSGQALIAHLGDSRIYLHRAGKLEQLTRDHSLAQQMLDRGEITPVEAFAARLTGGPSRFLGMPGKAVADTSLVPLQSGDRLLLTSDGLCEMLLDDDILAILNKTDDLEEACQRLVAAANAAGGHDNITVLLIGAG